MGISLQKGQRVSLDKVSPGLEAIFVGLGWDVNATDSGADFDLDASVFMLGSNEKLLSDNHLVFYNNLKSPDPDHSVEHMGDNLTGAGEGDDEVVIVNLKKVPEDVKKLIFVVTIYDADQRQQNFGQVENAFVRLVDVKTKEEVLRYDLTEDYSVETALIMAELYKKDGQWRMSAVGAGYEGGLETILNSYYKHNWKCQKRLTPNAGKVNAIAISPNGQTFISGHQNKSVKLWSIETGGERYSFQDHTNEVLAVAYHPNGEIIASGSRDKTLKFWSVATGKLLTTLEGHSHEILGLTFSRDGKILGSCSKDKTVKLWSVEEETLLETLSHYQDEVSAIALSPDGKWLATGEGNIGQTVRLLQLENRELFTLEKDELAWFPGIHSLAFSPDSRFLVGGRNDNQIVLWNVKQQEEIRRFQGHENKVYTVAFHPHKNLIISGSEEATLKLWNLNTGEELLTLKGHEKAVLATAISPDGNYLISGSQDQTLLIWKSEWQSRPDVINLEE